MTIPNRRSTRVVAGIGIASASVLLIAGPAAADTSQARARAARVSLLGGTIVDTGQVTATNTGAGETKTGTTTGTGVLPGQTLIAAGVLAQDATARNNGTSAACAGLVGSGGTIQIGAALGCTMNLGTPSGVVVNLNNGLLGGLATVNADAIFAECSATTTTRTGKATVVNARINLLGLALPISLNVSGAPNQGLSVPGIASVLLNEQVNNPDGSLTVNALHITLLGTTGNALAEVIIGSATCGPNAVTPPISLIGGPALPAAAAGALAVGAVAILRRRRRIEA